MFLNRKIAAYHICNPVNKVASGFQDVLVCSQMLDSDRINHFYVGEGDLSTLGQISKSGQFIRYLLLFVLAMFFMVVFFGWFGQYFIPLILVVLCLAFLAFSGAGRRASSMELLFIVPILFIFGVVIQRFSIATLSSLSDLLNAPIDNEAIASSVPSLGLVLIIALMAIYHKQRMARRR